MDVQRSFSLGIACLLAFALAVAGCSGPMEYQMESGERTASSEGVLLVEFDDNDNRFMQLTVAHLPPPSRLEEGLSTYVVWLQPDGAGVNYNMGQLKVGDDRSGYIAFTSPFDSFQLRVTAEVDANVHSPSDHVVLRRAIGGS